MRIKSLLLTACALMLGMSTWAKDYRYTTVEGDLMKTRIYTLDNGLRVYLSVNPEKPRIQTYIAVRTGSKNDPAETTGLAHYLEHLMFKGTKLFGTNNYEAEAPLLDEIEQRYETYRLLTDPEARRQAYHEIDSVSQIAARYFIPNEYDKLMATIGANGTNAYTSNDVTCYTEDIPSNEIENWARIQSDRFQNMVIRGFHTELEAVYEEYNIGLTQDIRKLFEAFTRLLLPNHPYGTQTTIGTQEHLKNPSIVNIKNYFNKWYRPNNVAICMAGDFDPDATIAIIDKHFSSWQPGADVRQPTFAPLPPLTQPIDTTVVGPEAEQIWIGWRARQANALQADTLELIDEVLSNGRTGLLDINLNQKVMVQRASAGTELMRDHGAYLLMGTPKEGQSLDEVRALLLGEIDKLKRGEFSEQMLPAILKNKKRQYQQSLEDNRSRADQFVDAFINEVEWPQAVGRLDRLAKISKSELVDFARRFFTDGLVTVYKRQGIDSTQKKIDKPAITPIPTNRDQMSDFVKQIMASEVEPIQPRFVDFNTDLTLSTTKQRLPLLYVQNKDNDLFELIFHFPNIGKKDDNRYEVATSYLMNYLGTDKLSAEDIKQQFYDMACSYHISTGNDRMEIQLRGLSESMPEALKLLEHLIGHAQVDREAYDRYVSKILKQREMSKKQQRQCFEVFNAYAQYGPRNYWRDEMSASQLRDTDPQTLIDLLRHLSDYEHEVHYYGPMTIQQVSALVSKEHKTPKHLMPSPNAADYTMQPATTNEVWLAPYEAKNIYMRTYYNDGKPWSLDEAATITVFNEYFGGGMNGVVFQEMREARGLAYNASAIYRASLPSRSDYQDNFQTHIITQNDKMVDCINEFHHIIDEFPQNEGAFQIAKDAVTKQLASQRTTKMNIINRYTLARKLGLDTDPYAKIFSDLARLKLSDIVAFEQQNMARKPMRYIILGDEKSLDMQVLQQIGPVRRVSLEEAFGY